jgi:hypothetical protein
MLHLCAHLYVAFAWLFFFASLKYVVKWELYQGCTAYSALLGRGAASAKDAAAERKV